MGQGGRAFAAFVVLCGCTVAIGFFVASIFAPRITSETSGIAIGISNSKACGQWEYNRNAPKEELLKDFTRAYLKEDRAAQYAQNCYGLSEARLDTSIGCDRFYKKDFTFHHKNDTRCPVRNTSMCVDSYGADAYWTDLIPAKDLGINTGDDSFAFRRNLTCSPIKLEGYWERNGSRYFYNYGEKRKASGEVEKHTYYTDDDVLKWEIPQYSLE